MAFVRYHLNLKKGRTTVSLDKMLSNLVAVKLGYKMGTKEAHSAVREKLMSFISDDPTRDGYHLASFMSSKAALFIADKKTCDKYWDNISIELEEDEELKNYNFEINNQKNT